MSSNMSPVKRHCFVTVGSIASFRDLLAEILQPPFLVALRTAAFTELVVQCGPDYEWFKNRVDNLDKSVKESGLTIHCFDYTKGPEEMKEYMLQCRGLLGKRASGCIISHAGMRLVFLSPQFLVLFFF